MGAKARSVVAVVIGLAVAVLLIAIVEAVSSQVYHRPSGLDTADPAVMREYITALPAGAFAFVLVGWALGTFAGAWTAAKLAGRAPQRHANIVGTLLLGTGVANMLMLPHPAWVWVLGVIVFVGCGYGGGWVAARSAGMAA
jgi:ABC-type antimicrobial peptide transport system permease subunit